MKTNAGKAHLPNKHSFPPLVRYSCLDSYPFVVSSADCGRHFITNRKFHRPEAEKAAPLPQEESIDRITVKDGSRIHIIKVEDLLYIQACGDYTTLVTPDGEYIKEQTMKYFETHLPADNFVQNYLFLYFAMMKHLYYILMFTFLCLGLTAISQEEQPNSRNTAGVRPPNALLPPTHNVHRTQSPTVHFSMTKIPTAGPTKRCVRTVYTHITTPLRNS